MPDMLGVHELKKRIIDLVDDIALFTSSTATLEKLYAALAIHFADESKTMRSIRENGDEPGVS